VVREIALMSRDPRFVGRQVASIYFGGGTPSLMPVGDVARVLDAARGAFPVDPDAEISLEANPDALEKSSLDGLRAAGVVRLTLGWQALDDARLKVLGRTNRRTDNVAALRDARAAGFTNLAVDLIFGTPSHTLEEWTRELEETADSAPDHVSAYELTIEEGTVLGRRHRAGRVSLPDEEARAAMFERTDEVLARTGIRRYEISNFARAGFECRHNSSSWRSQDLLGVGASAASHVANARWTNVADVDEFVRRIEAGEPASTPAEILDETTWAAEDLYLGLRLVEGVRADARLARVPEPGRSRLAGILGTFRDGGLVERTAERDRLTRRGLLLADTVFEELLTLR
jgi:oxygen-independent coproporphyrinogen-3 oxidase